LAAVAIASSAASAHAQTAGIVPTSIDIPSIGAPAVVLPLGEDPDGTMQAPSDPDTVGWYEPGIGIPGNAVLDGHVDWGGRLGVFGRLRQLGPGDAIQITDADGDVLSYSVRSSP
jgi:sortase (surface protein transpeptidase)